MHRPLVRSGFALVLVSLLTGLAVPALASPRLGLAAHVAGLLGGVLLVVLGVVAPTLVLRPRAARAAAWGWGYAAWANWLACLLGGITGASRLTPIAGRGTSGAPAAEAVVAFLLLSLSLAAIAAAAVTLWGLRGRGADDASGVRAPHGFSLAPRATSRSSR